MNMPQELNRDRILENLKLLSEWLGVKYAGETFELTVVGGAAMAIAGFKDQTKDIDLLRPARLPPPLREAITHISRAKRLTPEWLNTSAANVLRKVKPSKGLPDYFNEISQTIEIGGNLRVNVIGRQALIALKLLAATPSHEKHTSDIRALQPGQQELSHAVKFVLSIDSTQSRKDDLRIVLRELGCDFDELCRISRK
jgi:hypothetical protein